MVLGPGDRSLGERVVSSITVKMKDGTTREFPHQGRAGGSYTKRLSFEPGFVVITDEYYQRTCIPERDVKEVIESPDRY